jgi:hypothetical protein
MADCTQPVRQVANLTRARPAVIIFSGQFVRILRMPNAMNGEETIGWAVIAEILTFSGGDLKSRITCGARKRAGQGESGARIRFDSRASKESNGPNNRMKDIAMNLKRFSVRLVFCAAILVLAERLPAQGMTAFGAVPSGSRVKLDGTSTIHDWTIEGALIGGSLELDSAFIADPSKAKPGKISAKAQVIIPVRSLKSGKDSMDSVMQEAMKQTDFPRIEYRLAELTLLETPKSAAGPYLFESKGDLTISGVTNQVAMRVSIQKLENNKLKTTGETAVKMTSFKITPPAPKIALGFISTGDEVKINFDWVTVQK